MGLSTVSISAARARANELNTAINNLNRARIEVLDAINKLNNGASAKRIKNATLELNELKETIDSEIQKLKAAATQIVTIAQSLQSGD